MESKDIGNRRVVLGEDEYVGALDEIIRRDYYPGTLPVRDDHGDSDDGGDNDDNDDGRIVSLTKFHQQNTSEDNEYFHHQHLKDLEAHRSAYSYAYKEGKPLLLMPDGKEQTSEMLARIEPAPLASDEFDLHPKGGLDAWKYRASNSLMMTPGGINKQREICGLKKKGGGGVGGLDEGGGGDRMPLSIAEAKRRRDEREGGGTMPPPPPLADKKVPKKIESKNTRFSDSSLFAQFIAADKELDANYEKSHATSEYSGDSSRKDGKYINGYA